MEFVIIIGAILALAALGACLGLILLALSFIFWLASLPLKLVGILPGIWWGDRY